MIYVHSDRPVALITGASSGIGQALSQQLLAQGYEVWGTQRNNAVQHPLSAADAYVSCELDLTDSHSIQRLAERLQQRGRLDVLIHNAGYGAIGPILDMPAETLEQQFQVNVLAIPALTRACLPLLEQQPSTVVVIGSVSGVLVTPFAGAYCASKAAVHALCQALRMELSVLAINLIEVQPGAIQSHFADRAEHELNRWFSPQHRWWLWRDGVRKRSTASRNRPTPAETVATRITRELTRSRPAPIVRVGHGSKSLIWLRYLLPMRWREYLLQRVFGLTRHG